MKLPVKLIFSALLIMAVYKIIMFGYNYRYREFYKTYNEDKFNINMMDKYTLKERWDIFKYGMNYSDDHYTLDKEAEKRSLVPITPINLAFSIAKGGHEAADVVLNDLDYSIDERGVVYSIIVFGIMERNKYYDICSDKLRINKIKNNANKIHSSVWNPYYKSRLKEMCHR